jgi:flap endonuclease-1
LQTQRRREARNVDSARAHIETQRYHRLRDLHQLLAEAQTLSTQERNQLLDAFTLSVGNPAVLDDVISTMGHEDISSSQGLYSGSSERASRDGVSASSRSRAATWRHPETKSFDTVTNDDIEYILRHELPTGTSKAHITNEKDYGTPSGSLLPSIGFPEDRHEEPTLTPGLSPLRSLAEALQGLSLKSKEKGAGQLTSVINTAPLTAGTLITAFSQLFVKFQNSVPEVAASAAEVEEQALSTQPAEDTSTIKNQYSISKYQEALTVAEAKIWKELSQLDVDIAYADLQVQVVSLLEQSQTMTESYDRRTNPPTAKTYQECQEILGALGVPIIIPNGPYEAEALAATLVVRGHADYVVSEDTVSIEWFHWLSG